MNGGKRKDRPQIDRQACFWSLFLFDVAVNPAYQETLFNSQPAAYYQGLYGFIGIAIIIVTGPLLGTRAALPITP